MLRTIYAIKFYQYHKSKYTHTGWEYGWEEEQSKLNSLDLKKKKKKKVLICQLPEQHFQRASLSSEPS